MPGSVAILDGNGFDEKVNWVQRLLQQASNSHWAEGKNSNRNAGIQRCEHQIISVAGTLPWALPDPNRGMSANSPATGSWIGLVLMIPHYATKSRHCCVHMVQRVR